jgi:hypothetical protein
MKLSLENTQKKQRVRNLWKLDYPPQDPEQRWAWIYEVEDHLFGTREMQNERLKAWGFSYTRKDRRKKPLRDKMGGISLRARDREFKIMQLRSMSSVKLHRQRIKEASDVLRLVNPDIILLQEVRDQTHGVRLFSA